LRSPANLRKASTAQCWFFSRADDAEGEEGDGPLGRGGGSNLPVGCGARHAHEDGLALGWAVELELRVADADGAAALEQRLGHDLRRRVLVISLSQLLNQHVARPPLVQDPHRGDGAGLELENIVSSHDRVADGAAHIAHLLQQVGQQANEHPGAQLREFLGEGPAGRREDDDVAAPDGALNEVEGDLVGARHGKVLGAHEERARRHHWPSSERVVDELGGGGVRRAGGWELGSELATAKHTDG